jgi:tRNA A37 threonylcarbamoyladenosine dehydratase
VENQFERTEKLIGREALLKLAASRVAVFGIGGVGGSCAEALARMGVGAIDLFDNDKVTLSNLNRQIVALHSTVGKYKVDVMADRIKDINPGCKVAAHKIFYTADNAEETDLSVYDCVIDAIDTVAGKIELIVRAKAAGVHIICAMGAGNKMDPAGFTVTDINKTETDPLAKVIRKELRTRGIKDVPVVWSKEQPRKHIELSEDLSSLASSKGLASNSFVPPAAGLILAAEVIQVLI